MASSYSNLKLELIGTGEQVGQWGSTTNTNLGTALEEAVVGSADVTFASADVNLTLVDSNATQTARNYRLNLVGTSGGARKLFLSTGANIEKPYIINNGLADAVTVQNKIGGVASGAGVTVPAGKTMLVYNTGTNIVEVQNYTSVASGGTGRSTLTAESVLLGNGTSPVQLVAPGTVNNVLKSDGTTWISGDTPAAGSNSQVQFNNTGVLDGSGALTFDSVTGALTATSFSGSGASLTTLNADNVSSGTLVVARGGTGATTLTNGGILRGNGTAPVSAASASDIVSAIGSTAVTNATNATNATTATTATNIAGGAANRIVYNTGSGTTGFITAPTVSSTYLQWNGSAFVWQAISASGVLSVTASSPLSSSGGSNPNITLGTVPVASGGTGSTTASGARTNLGLGDMATQSSSNVSITGGSISGVSGLVTTSGTQTISGAKTFSGGVTSSSWNFSSTSSFYLNGSVATLDISSTNVVRFDNSGGTGRIRFVNTDYGVQSGGSSIQIGYIAGTYFTISGTTSSGVIESTTSDCRKPGGGSWNSTSDSRLKENVVNYAKGLNAIKSLRTVNYNYNDATKLGADTNYKTFTGLIAQEVEQTDFSSMVATDKDGYKTLDSSELTYALINAVKELSAQVDTLKAEIAALKGN